MKANVSKILRRKRQVEIYFLVRQNYLKMHSSYRKTYIKISINLSSVTISVCVFVSVAEVIEFLFLPQNADT